MMTLCVIAEWVEIIVSGAVEVIAREDVLHAIFHKLHEIVVFYDRCMSRLVVKIYIVTSCLISVVEYELPSCEPQDWCAG